MFLIAEVAFVGISPAVLEALWCGVMLNDVVVPVDNPDSAVRTNFGHDGRRPFVVAGDEVCGAGGFVAGAIATENERANEVSGGFADEGCFIPPLAGECAGSIERVSGSGGVATKLVNLPDIFGDCLEKVCVGNGSDICGRPATDLFVVAIGNGHEGAGIVIGGGAEDEAFFADAEAPGVVIGGANKFDVSDGGWIGLSESEAQNPWRKDSAVRSSPEAVFQRGVLSL